jgi:dTDP-4-dehydrorhamnose 3,5-epimerase
MLTIHRTSITGVLLVENTPFRDHRGVLARLFCVKELAPVLDDRRIVQITLSRTNVPGTVRGVHYQLPPCAEMKLVRCLKGRIWDVAVDLRTNSPTFLQWHAEELTPENGRMLVVPEGCGHGFQVLEPESEVLYLTTAGHEPDFEAGVRFDSPRLAIEWPLPPDGMSMRDRSLPGITDGFQGIPL